MNDWQRFFNHTPNALDQGTYRIFEPQYKAEILDWFSREDIPQQQKEAFIEALLDFDDGCGGFYRYQAYFIAAEAIAHFPDCSQAEAIVRQMLKWCYAYFRQEKPDWKTYPKAMVEAARATLERTNRERVVAHFVQLLHATESRTVLKLVAEKLGKLDPGNQHAIAALVLLAEFAQNESERLQIVERLERIAPGNHYLARFVSKVFVWVEDYQLIQSLMRIAATNSTAIASLKKILLLHQNEFIRVLVATQLLRTEPRNETAIDLLLQIAQTGSSPHVRCDAAYTLAEIERYRPLATNIILELFSTAYQRYGFDCGCCQCYVSTIERLRKIDPTNQLATNALVQWIETTLDRYVAHEILQPSASECGQIHRDEIDLLVAAGDLRWVAKGNKAAIAILERMLQSIQNQKILWQTAVSLGYIDSGNVCAIDTLVSLIESGTYKEDSYSLLNLAKSLNSIAPGHLVAVDTFLKLIQIPQEDYIRLGAACQLLEIESVRERAIETLIELIRFSEDYNRLNAACQLLKIESVGEMAIETLIEFILNSEDYASVEAARNLRALSVDSETIVSTILEKSSARQYKYNDDCYEVLWHCAQKLSYPEFYRVWHRQPLAMGCWDEHPPVDFSSNRIVEKAR